MKSRRVLAWIYRGLAVSGVALAVLGLYLGVQSESNAGAPRGRMLALDPPTVTLGVVPHEARVPVKVMLSNRGDNGIRVLGLERTCSPWGCTDDSNLPLRIPPGQSRQIEMMFYAPRRGFVGPFSSEISLYTDSPETARLALGIQGEVIARPADD